MAPSHPITRRGMGKDKPSLEGGEERRIQVMDITATQNSSNVDELEPEDIPRLCEKWLDRYTDIINGVPLVLPPLRAINHRIPLISDSKRYHYHLPRCLDAMKPQLMEKLWQYINAGWWIPKTAPQAAPLLCIPKKSGKLCTVVDCRQRNDNTVKDITPFPDQDQIRMDVARAKYCSKIDLSNTYEQVRIEPNDVSKTAFTMVFGTFESNVMQQGNCNAPTTFQQLMVEIFRDAIGISIHVYLNNIFVFSYMMEDHEKDLEYVFQKLQENRLFIEKAKCDLYSKNMDCLGHCIDDRGLHADADKMPCI
jgi:hypothetical protein